MFSCPKNVKRFTGDKLNWGQIKLISGLTCDGYVLDDGTAVMSERGAADLLGIDHMLLNRMQGDSFPESIKPFIDENFCMEENPLSEVSESPTDKNPIMETNSSLKTPSSFIINGFIMETNLVEVVAENSPYQGRKIVVYTAKTVEILIFAYAMALAHRKLRKNQRHIGERCVILMRALVRTALEAAIKEACGLPLNIQATAQQHFIDIVKMTRDLGLKPSVEDDIVTKKDMLEFLGITMGKLNGHLRKHREHIKAIPLTRRQILKTGSRASHMKGFPINDAVKIILGMDSVPGIELKKQLFGPLGIFVTPDTSKEIQWEAKLSTAFNGFGFYSHFYL